MGCDQSPTVPEMRPEIRPATTDDLPSMKAIYDEQVRGGTSTFHVEPPPLSYWEDRLAADSPGEHLLVAIDTRVEAGVEAGVQAGVQAGVEGAVLGYAYSSTYRPRPAYDRTRETAVYLADEARGQGLGRALYDDLLARLRADDVHTVLAVVALPNPASEALHRACGFTRVGVLPEVGRKFDRWIDTAMWVRVL